MKDSMPTRSQHTQYSVDLSLLEPFLGGRTFDEAYAEYDDKGYVIFKNIMPQTEIARIRNTLTPYLTKTGRNNF